MSNSTFERDGRVSRCGSALWRMSLTEKISDDPKSRHKRRLILEPYESPGGAATCLNAWVEEDRPIYIYTTEDPRQRPKGRPKWTTEVRELGKSRHAVRVQGACWNLVTALARNELIGRSASEGIYTLFWECFVKNVDEMAFLQRVASKETGKFWAQQRFRTLTTMPGCDPNDPVVKMLDDGAFAEEPHLACLAWQRAQVDSNFYDAIEAIAKTNEAEFLLKLLRAQDWRKGKRETS